jgi:hypothetical protein
MRIKMPRGSFISILVELTGLKSGLAIGDLELCNVLDEAFDNVGEATLLISPTSKWWFGPPGEHVVIRAEELQENFTNVLYGVGAIPDRMDPNGLLVAHVKEQIQKKTGVHPTKRDVYAGAMTLQRKIMQNDCCEDSAAFLVEYRRRDILSDCLPEQRTWDGQLNLNDLFQSESIPSTTTEGQYFDQRYIDYLSRRVGQIEKIHWRQFEYLTAEFFSRNGYKVKVTPARGDGGIDVVALRESAPLGPELVLIQCKRHASSNEVTINSVKALWTDIQDQNATKGVIATTGYLEKGAREFCEARQYRIQSAERNNIQSWIDSMSSHHAPNAKKINH